VTFLIHTVSIECSPLPRFLATVSNGFRTDHLKTVETVLRIHDVV
jgi:hypothetical protein